MNYIDHSLTTVGFLRLDQVLRLYPISKSSWWDGVKDGRFPKPIKLGPRTTAWKTSDVMALIAAATSNLPSTAK
jgi:predicted DNA-binding transcriptional regulator AlpA